MDFTEFSSLDLASKSGEGFVYVLCYTFDGKEVPFYVGETQSILGRLNDYYWAEFQAATDFKVGEAVRWFNERGMSVVARYRVVPDRKSEEKRIINLLCSEGLVLLNSFRGFDYRKTIASKERIRVHDFLSQMVG